jgi:cytochrome c biogenesis protein ResB
MSVQLNFMLSLLSSLRLTTALLSLLALLTLAGAAIPQTGDNQPLVTLFGEPFARLLSGLRLTAVFRSPLFFLILAGLFINLVSCTQSRLRRRIAQRLMKALPKTPAEIERLPSARSLPVDDIESGRCRLMEAMTDRGFTSFSEGSHLVFTKGRLGWLAGPFTHAGLFLLLLGVTVNALFGFAGDVSGSEGSHLSVPATNAAQPLLGSPVQKSLLQQLYKDLAKMHRLLSTHRAR